MNISELIEVLKQHPQDMRVCVQGYEGGISDILRIEWAITHKVVEHGRDESLEGSRVSHGGCRRAG